MSIYMNGQEYAPILRYILEVVDLSSLTIYTGNYLDTTSYTVTKGAVDKYTRELVS